MRPDTLPHAKKAINRKASMNELVLEICVGAHASFLPTGQMQLQPHRQLCRAIAVRAIAWVAELVQSELPL